MYIYIYIYNTIKTNNNNNNNNNNSNNNNNVFAYIYICNAIKINYNNNQENNAGKRDSIHHHLPEVIVETATVPELRQKLLYTTPSGWWWCIESVFRNPAT